MDHQQSPPLQSTHNEQSPLFSDDKATAKAPVVRGARACTVCRAAKMKCVGADDGNNIPCQRCKRSGAECIFEKHRRGRKPGSRLSEASKMLRRLEKGLNSAKQKSTVSDSLTLPPLHDSRATDTRFRNGDGFSASGPSSSHFASNQLPPLNLPSIQDRQRSDQLSDSEMDEDEDMDQKESGLYPARIIKQNSRNSSFFKTILNPEHAAPPVARPTGGSLDRGYPQHSQAPAPFTPSLTDLFRNETPLKDPIDAGLIDEKTVAHLWDMFFIRLNPFINLFDPALHTVAYVRSHCPFLFTALVMACCKFFKPELYVKVLRLAHEFAVRAFAENWSRVEVVQAFACMIYWKEPDDTRVWTYIGYACRMAVELSLNRYVGKPPQGETVLQRRERRNRERTYLVLFVHDRSLSMQTGKHWMLPEDELVRHASTWHEEGGDPIRQEDVIVAAFTQLRRIAAETTDVFNNVCNGGASSHGELNYGILLSNCNQKLNQWVQMWQQEMQRARGESFHFSFLQFFQLHVRLFLNTFGVYSSSSQAGRGPVVNSQALLTCYTSAMDNLKIMADDFARISMLRYGQDSTTVMTAYSAVVLLKLLRGSNELVRLKEDVVKEIHSVINRTAQAYEEAAPLSPASSSAAYHARFLQSLVDNDLRKMHQQAQAQVEQERFKRELPPLNPALHPVQSNGVGRSVQGYGQSSMYSEATPPAGQMNHSGYYPQSSTVTQSSSIASTASPSSTLSSAYSPTPPTPYAQTREVEYATADPTNHNGALANFSLSGISTTYAQYQAQPTSEHDAMYWRNMFKDLGFENGDQTYGGGYQTQTIPEETAAAIPASYSNVSYREAHASEHGYQSHHAPSQHYQYPVMNSYQPSTYASR